LASPLCCEQAAKLAEKEAKKAKLEAKKAAQAAAAEKAGSGNDKKARAKAEAEAKKVRPRRLGRARAASGERPPPSAVRLPWACGPPRGGGEKRAFVRTVASCPARPQPARRAGG
jgi:hypothetical protein